MKKFIFILITLLCLLSCKQQNSNNQQPPRELTELDIATLAVRCVNALENKRDMEESFNVLETVGQLCTELGMKCDIDTIIKTDQYSGRITRHSCLGRDSLAIILLTGEQQIEIGISNPLRYGKMLPEKYQTVIWNEFRSYGWQGYLARTILTEFPHGIGYKEQNGRNFYNLHLYIKSKK